MLLVNCSAKIIDDGSYLSVYSSASYQTNAKVKMCCLGVRNKMIKLTIKRKETQPQSNSLSTTRMPEEVFKCRTHAKLLGVWEVSNHNRAP